VGSVPASSAPPVPPGHLTVSPSPSDARAFLEQLGPWVTGLRAQLDRLDADSQLASNPDSYTSDIALAMSLYQSIRARHDELIAVWENGRVGPDELARLAVLMWGRLPDPLGAASAFTLTEAGTLVSALTDRLSDALAADAVAGSGVAGRITLLQAAIERCRSLAAVLGVAAARVDEMAGQVASTLASKDRERITAMVTAFDPEATAIERDLIKETSLRTRAARLSATFHDRLTALPARCEALDALAARSRSRIADLTDAPVPALVTLGPPPVVPTGGAAHAAEWSTARDELDRYAAQLDQFERALAAAETHYGAPLRARDDLRGLLGAYETRAARSGLAEDGALTAAYRAAHVVLWSAPCDLRVAERLVEQYQDAVRIAVGAERAVEPSANETVATSGREGEPV
jgi:hypothetical protein